MKKIAFIIVRYGENINGGAEVHCQMLAERLLPITKVEVLATTIRAFNHRIKLHRKVSAPGTASPYAVSSRSHRPGAIQALRKKYKTARRIRQYLKKAEPAARRRPSCTRVKSGIEKRTAFLNRRRPMPRACCVISKATRLNMAFIFANFYAPSGSGISRSSGKSAH